MSRARLSPKYEIGAGLTMKAVTFCKLQPRRGRGSVVRSTKTRNVIAEAERSDSRPATDDNADVVGELAGSESDELRQAGRQGLESLIACGIPLCQGSCRLV